MFSIYDKKMHIIVVNKFGHLFPPSSARSQDTGSIKSTNCGSIWPRYDVTVEKILVGQISAVASERDNLFSEMQIHE